MKRWILVWGLMCLWPLVATAGEPVSLRLTQAVAAVPSITAWLEVLDAAGERVSDLEAQQFSTTVGSQAAVVQALTPFSEGDTGIAFVFLADVSKSLSETRFAEVRGALKGWIEALGDKDWAALLTFGSTVKRLQDFTQDRAALQAAVEGLRPTDMETFLHQGLVQAMAMARRRNATLPERRVIVALSDGLDDAAGGVTAEEVFRDMQVDRVPVYAIGFASPTLTPAKRTEGLKALGEFARTSGGAFFDAGTDSLAAAYATQRQRIAESLVATIHCDACVADGRVYWLNVTLSAGPRTLSDGLDLRLLPQPAVPSVRTEAPADTPHQLMQDPQEAQVSSLSA